MQLSKTGDMKKLRPKRIPSFLSPISPKITLQGGTGKEKWREEEKETLRKGGEEKMAALLDFML